MKIKAKSQKSITDGINNKTMLLMKTDNFNPENISDGYHTFKELYEFRMLYNANLFNSWSGSGEVNVYKSKRHDDNLLCFGGGWFIVVADLPSGQISNHYEYKDWDLFNIPEFDKSPLKFDGHSSLDVSERLRDFAIKG